MLFDTDFLRKLCFIVRYLHIVQYVISVLGFFKTVLIFKVCLSMFQVFAILSHGILGVKAPLGSLEVKVKVKVKVKPPKSCGIVRRALKKCES